MMMMIIIIIGVSALSLSLYGALFKAQAYLPGRVMALCFWVGTAFVALGAAYAYVTRTWHELSAAGTRASRALPVGTGFVALDAEVALPERHSAGAELVALSSDGGGLLADAERVPVAVADAERAPSSGSLY
jgi:hypothetical protein